MSFKKYKRTAIAEMREVESIEIDWFQQRGEMIFYLDSDKENEEPLRVSISDEDLSAGSPKIGDMIARNPDNHRDQWLVAEEYFKKNFTKDISTVAAEHRDSAYKSDKEFLNYVYKHEGDHSYIEFSSEKNIMNAIAAKFGFKQDGSFKLVQGIHDLASNSTEDSWRMYGRKETLKMEAVFPGFGETTEFKRLPADKLIVLLNYYQYPVVDPLGLSHPILDELYIDGFIDKTLNKEIVSWKLTEKGREYVSGILNVQIVKSDKDFNGLLRIGKGTFGMAVEAAKHDLKVARKGWNGSGMFAYIVPAASYPALSEVAKKYFGDGAPVPYRAYWALKTAQGDVATWAPSGSDSLAEDWMIVE